MGQLIVLLVLLGAGGLAISERRRRRAGYAESGGVVVVTTSDTTPAELVTWVRWQLWSLATGRLPRPVAGLLLAVAILLIGDAQLKLVAPALANSSLVIYAVGLLLLAGLDAIAVRVSEREVESASGFEARLPKLARKQAWLIAGALIAAVVVWDQAKGRSQTDSYSDVTILWLLAMATLIVAALPWPPSVAGLRQWWQRGFSWLDWLLLAGATTVALAARVTNVGSQPFAFGSDEASMAIAGLRVLHGQLTNPFGTGFLAFPNLFFFLQAAMMRLFGETVAGARMLSVILGTLGVIFTFLLARRLFGAFVGFVAALILAVFSFDLQFSRMALNNIADPLALTAALYFLDRGFRQGRRLDFLLAGLSVGLDQYFYASRIIPITALAVLVYGAWRMPKACWQRIGWVLAGAGVAFLPLLGYYQTHPDQFNLRFNQMSIFSNNWLPRAEQFFHMSGGALLAWWFQRAALLPFHTHPGGWFNLDTPFVGVPLAMALAVGLAIVSLGALRREYFPLAVAYWVAVVGLFFTDDPSQTPRFTVASPVIAILAAIAVSALLRILLHTLGLARPAALGLAAVAAAALIGWNFNYYFLAPNPQRFFNDPNTWVATDLGYHLQTMSGSQTVYFFGAPRMLYSGFSTLPFLAPDARGIDVEKPWTATTARPQVSGSTVFAFVPERLAELQLVRGWFPNGHLQEYRSPDGQPLLSVYDVSS